LCGCYYVCLRPIYVHRIWHPQPPPPPPPFPPPALPRDRSGATGTEPRLKQTAAQSSAEEEVAALRQRYNIKNNDFIIYYYQHQ